MLREKEIKGLAGWPMLLAMIAVALFAVVSLIGAIKDVSRDESGLMVVVWIVVLFVDLVCLAGLTVVNPNEAKVVQLFGAYQGTLKTQGMRWVNPLTSRRRVSLRVRNFESGHLKVNDHDGNPIEIAAVVVWRVVETAEAVFHVDDYEDFVHVQSEAAVRNLATSYPYDAHQDGHLSLRMSAGEIALQLRKEVQERLDKAGVEVIEARLSHLAYAPEIASAMLRRQQASAVIAARTRIVEGAVGMVEMALAALSEKGVVHLDEERKAQMVSNLLVVLCSDRDAQPVVNTGTLYQ
ncbi:MAG: SPFH domain-containing protein [Acidobacteria bacterium]|nr:SPFH domain-containing protein [Acidobacteriota bacterium]